MEGRHWTARGGEAGRVREKRDQRACYTLSRTSDFSEHVIFRRQCQILRAAKRKNVISETSYREPLLPPPSSHPLSPFPSPHFLSHISPPSLPALSIHPPRAHLVHPFPLLVSPALTTFPPLSSSSTPALPLSPPDLPSSPLMSPRFPFISPRSPLISPALPSSPPLSPRFRPLPPYLPQLSPHLPPPSPRIPFPSLISPPPRPHSPLSSLLFSSLPLIPPQILSPYPLPFSPLPFSPLISPIPLLWHELDATWANLYEGNPLSFLHSTPLVSPLHIRSPPPLLSVGMSVKRHVTSFFRVSMPLSGPLFSVSKQLSTCSPRQEFGIQLVQRRAGEQREPRC
ncbi:unnamed protein product [Closterium sp. Naga37s-1]|nr:unnamed protein product [Closterium sp. Naga37s-1]